METLFPIHPNLTSGTIEQSIKMSTMPLLKESSTQDGITSKGLVRMNLETHRILETKQNLMQKDI